MVTYTVEFVRRHEIDPQRALVVILSEGGQKGRVAGFVYRRGKHPADVDELTMQTRGARKPEAAVARAFDLAFADGYPPIQLYPRTSIWRFEWGWPSPPALLRYAGFTLIKKKWKRDPNAPLPLLEAVSAAYDRVVFVVWSTGSMCGVDVRPALEGKRRFRKLLEDDDLFRTMKVTADRSAIRWADGSELTALWLEDNQGNRSNETD